jgi:hypothetical protein
LVGRELGNGGKSKDHQLAEGCFVCRIISGLPLACGVEKKVETPLRDRVEIVFVLVNIPVESPLVAVGIPS